MATLWLIGMMGAGKTTIGVRAAARLGVPFVDLDDDVVATAGSTIPEIFAEHGETTFRALERDRLLARAGEAAVVACGGGVVLDEANREAMSDSGLVIWLDAPLDVLQDRLGSADGRPLLAGGVERRLEELAARRRHLYRDAADVRVDAAGGVEDVVDRVEAAWNAS